MPNTDTHRKMSISDIQIQPFFSGGKKLFEKISNLASPALILKISGALVCICTLCS